MDSSLNQRLKCRICLSRCTNGNFVRLNESRAKMFEVVGVKLTVTTDGAKSESVVCQPCFKELLRFRDAKEIGDAKGIRAHQEYFDIQWKHTATRSCTQQKSIEAEEASDEVEPHDAQTIEQHLPVEAKHELPRATIDHSEEEDFDDSNRQWLKSVELTKFDARWQSESALFQTFLRCEHCQLVVKYQRNLSRHMKACSKIIPARFECDICGGRIQMKSLMVRHMLKHSNERNLQRDKPIACSTCQKKFVHHQHLKLHQMHNRHGIYSTAPEETYNCDKCDKKFSTPKYLRQHQQQVHDENEAKCNVCDKIFKNRAYLLQHVQTHAKLECSICHRKIAKNKMAFHVRSHDRNFECDFCAYSCHVKGNLKLHIERMHCGRGLARIPSAVEISPSSSCWKSFSVKSKVRQHRKRKKFVVAARLNQHKRQVHREKSN